MPDNIASEPTAGENPPAEVTATAAEVETATESVVVAGNPVRRPRRKAAKVNPAAVSQDADNDGFIDVDPKAAELLITELVALDVRLRENGSSVVELLNIHANSVIGFRP